MITVIRIAPFGLFYYCKKPVTGRLVRSCQNDHFIVVARLQNESSLSSESDENWLQDKNNRLTTDLHTPGMNQIPIELPHSEIPSLGPAVSSFGACPTPAP